MDYQPMGQTPNPMMNQTPEPVMSPMSEPSSSNGIRYVIGAVVIIVLGLWYFYGAQSATTDTSATGMQATADLTPGDTVKDISTDLSQVQDPFASLNTDAAASAQDIQSL